MRGVGEGLHCDDMEVLRRGKYLSGEVIEGDVIGGGGMR